MLLFGECNQQKIRIKNNQQKIKHLTYRCDFEHSGVFYVAPHLGTENAIIPGDPTVDGRNLTTWEV